MRSFSLLSPGAEAEPCALVLHGARSQLRRTERRAANAQPKQCGASDPRGLTTTTARCFIAGGSFCGSPSCTIQGSLSRPNERANARVSSLTVAPTATVCHLLGEDVAAFHSALQSGSGRKHTSHSSMMSWSTQSSSIASSSMARANASGVPTTTVTPSSHPSSRVRICGCGGGGGGSERGG